MGAFLRNQGIAEDDLAWFERRARKPDILGFDFYPDIEVYSQNADFTKNGTVPPERGARGLRRAHAYFNPPVYLTDTSAGLTSEAKGAYINALYDMASVVTSEAANGGRVKTGQRS
jgi:hypothetical protein